MAGFIFNIVNKIRNYKINHLFFWSYEIYCLHFWKRLFKLLNTFRFNSNFSSDKIFYSSNSDSLKCDEIIFVD